MDREGCHGGRRGCGLERDQPVIAFNMYCATIIDVA